MNRYGGVVFSQTVLLALVDSGMSRGRLPLGSGPCPYAWNVEGATSARRSKRPAVTDRIGAERLADCFSTERHQAQLDTIYARLAI